jgi:rhodanese-related sulfurtransferase
MKKLSLFLLAFLILAGCSVGDQDEGKKTNSGEYKSKAAQKDDGQAASVAKFKNVTINEAKEMIASEQVQIIDVRSQEMYKEGHIPNAKNIPLKELAANEKDLDKNETYLIVCKTGKTSETASKQLTESGFKNINNMSEGMDAWTGEVVK